MFGWYGSTIAISGSIITDSSADQATMMLPWPLLVVTITGVNALMRALWQNGGVALLRTSATINLTACNITKSKSSDAGGVIYGMDSNQIAISHSNFTGAEAFNGGAVQAKAATATISNTSFQGTSVQGNGGALAFTGRSSVSLQDCSFRDGSAGSGGALSITQALNIQIASCAFTAMQAGVSGGAIILASVQAANAAGLLCSNATAQSGGCISITQTQAVIRTSNFELSNGADGGAISMVQSEVNTTSCRFQHNAATGNGGALLVAQSTWASTDDTYTSNHATMSGGCAALQGGSRVTFRQAVLTKHSAMQGGGLFVSAGSVVSLWHSTISQTSVITQGGGIMVLNAQLMMAHSMLGSNQAPQGGGILDASTTTSSVVVVSSSIVNNGVARSSNADQQLGWTERGGGILQTCAKSSCIMHVNDTVLKSNVAVSGAGINQYAGEAQLVLANVTIHRNIATQDGGGAVLQGRAQLTAISLSQNSATQSGGALGIAGGASLVISGCNLTHNSAGYGGGAIHVASSRMNCTECRMLNNAAQGAGGAMALTGVSRVALTQSAVMQNTAKGNGGGISVTSQAVLAVTAVSNISGNTGAQGGGLYLSQSTVSLRDVTVDDNTATQAGGGVAAVQQSAINLISVSVRNNSAQTHGGGLLAMSTATRLFAGCMFEGNTANDLGGGLYWDCDCLGDCSTSQVDATTLANNTALAGGALYEAGCAIGARWPDLQAALSDSEHTSWDSNTAVYGALVASAPIFVNIIQIGSIWSGEPVMASTGAQLMVSLQDRYRQTIKDPTGRGELFRNGLEIDASTADSSVTLKGTASAVDAPSGEGDFGFLKITAPIGSTVTLSFSAATSPVISTRFNVTLQNCRVGAIPPAANIGECTPCPIGEYVLEGGTECFVCEDGATCYGGAEILPKPGYWHADAYSPGRRTGAGQSSVFYKCPFKGACLGDNNGCATGYTGVLCAKCEDAYQLSAAGCTACGEGAGGGGVQAQITSDSIPALCFLLLLAYFILRFIVHRCQTLYSYSKGDHIKALKKAAEEVFILFDTDSSGTVDHGEFYSAVRILRGEEYANSSDTKAVSRLVGLFQSKVDDSGLALPRFIELVLAEHDGEGIIDALRDASHSLQQYQRKAQMKVEMAAMQEMYTEAMLEELFKLLDEDGDGSIDAVEIRLAAEKVSESESQGSVARNAMQGIMDASASADSIDKDRIKQLLWANLEADVHVEHADANDVNLPQDDSVNALRAEVRDLRCKTKGKRSWASVRNSTHIGIPGDQSIDMGTSVNVSSEEQLLEEQLATKERQLLQAERRVEYAKLVACSHIETRTVVSALYSSLRGLVQERRIRAKVMSELEEQAANEALASARSKQDFDQENTALRRLERATAERSKAVAAVSVLQSADLVSQTLPDDNSDEPANMMTSAPSIQAKMGKLLRFSTGVKGNAWSAFGEPIGLIKIMTNQLQIISVFVSNLEVPWPGAFTEFLGFFSFLNFDMISITTPCVSMILYVPTLRTSHFDADCCSVCRYHKVVITLALPLFVMLIICLVVAVLYCLGRLSREQATTTVVKFGLTVIFLCFPLCVATSLQVFVCQEIDGVYYTSFDYRLECYDRPDHISSPVSEPRFYSEWLIYAAISAVGIAAYPAGQVFCSFW